MLVHTGFSSLPLLATVSYMANWCAQAAQTGIAWSCTDSWTCGGGLSSLQLYAELALAAVGGNQTITVNPGLKPGGIDSTMTFSKCLEALDPLHRDGELQTLFFFFSSRVFFRSKAWQQNLVFSSDQVKEPVCSLHIKHWDQKMHWFHLAAVRVNWWRAKVTLPFTSCRADTQKNIKHLVRKTYIIFMSNCRTIHTNIYSSNYNYRKELNLQQLIAFAKL